MILKKYIKFKTSSAANYAKFSLSCTDFLTLSYCSLFLEVRKIFMWLIHILYFKLKLTFKRNVISLKIKNFQIFCVTKYIEQRVSKFRPFKLQILCYCQVSQIVDSLKRFIADLIEKVIAFNDNICDGVVLENSRWQSFDSCIIQNKFLELERN